MGYIPPYERPRERKGIVSRFLSVIISALIIILIAYLFLSLLNL